MQIQSKPNSRNIWRFLTPFIGCALVLAVGIVVGLYAGSGGLKLESGELVVVAACAMTSFIVLGKIQSGEPHSESVDKSSVDLKAESDDSGRAADDVLQLSVRLSGLLGALCSDVNPGLFYEQTAYLLKDVLSAEDTAIYLCQNGAWQLVSDASQIAGFSTMVTRSAYLARERLETTDLGAFGVSGPGVAMHLGDEHLAILSGLSPEISGAVTVATYNHFNSAFRVFESMSLPRSELSWGAHGKILEQIYSATASPMCMLASEGTVLLGNQAFYAAFGQGSSDGILRVAELDCAQFFEALYTDAVVAHRRVSRCEELTRTDGTQMVCQAEALLLSDPANLADGRVTVLVRDISERQNLEDRLRRAARMEGIGQLAGGVAHDFNNILTVINGSAEFALESVSSGEDVTCDLEEILKAGRRAAVLTRQLLAFSRRQAMVIETMTYNELVCDLHGMLQRLIEEGIQLQLRLDPQIGLVRIDAGQMQQVLVNLVVNARDAIGPAGIITIETANVILSETFCRQHTGAEAGRFARLRVRDTGCGMSEGVLERVFEPFFTTKGPQKGTGLGLASVFGIVKQLGGNVYASSAKGIGSSFDVYLPLVSADGSPYLEGREAAEKDRLSAGARILVVEDQAQVRDLAVHMLKSLGYEVTGAPCGQAALELLTSPSRLDVDIDAQCPVDLIITDLVMPGMSGVELVARVRDVYPGLPVMFMSGHGQDVIARETVEAQQVPLLSKPFTISGLQSCVSRCLDGKG